MFEVPDYLSGRQFLRHRQHVPTEAQPELLERLPKPPAGAVALTPSLSEQGLSKYNLAFRCPFRFHFLCLCGSRVEVGSGPWEDSGSRWLPSYTRMSPAHITSSCPKPADLPQIGRAWNQGMIFSCFFFFLGFVFVFVFLPPKHRDCPCGLIIQFKTK